MKDNKLKLNIGIVSFITMFIILCLVTFAILSLVSAKRNQDSGNRYVQRMEEYYQLQNKAQEKLQEIDTFLKETYFNSTSSNDYFTKVQQLYVLDHNNQYHFVTKEGTLEFIVNITIQYPNAKEPFYIIEDWYSQSSEPWQAEYKTDLLSKGE